MLISPFTAFSPPGVPGAGARCPPDRLRNQQYFVLKIRLILLVALSRDLSGTALQYGCAHSLKLYYSMK